MNKLVFIDTFAWIAILNKSDTYHIESKNILKKLLEEENKLITTNFIIVETINALSKQTFRKSVVKFINRIEQSSSVKIVNITEEIYKSAWLLYQNRLDKDWGITDCTSFEIMKLMNIKYAFSNDKHFKQAGFSILVT